MNINTKLIAGIAAFSLFAFTANAQDATFTGDSAGVAASDGLTIDSAAATPVGNVAIDPTAPPVNNIIPTTAVVDPVSGAITTTIVNQFASYNGAYNDVQVVDINGVAATDTVSITSDGIVLNSTDTTPSTVDFDVRVTQVTVDDGQGNIGSITTTWTAEAVDANGVAIAGIAPFISNIDEFDAFLGLDFGALGALAADDASLAGVTTAGATASAGGDLTVGGNLALGAIADVEQAIGDNAGGIATNTTAIAGNAGEILANDGEILANTNAILANDGEILANTNAILANDGEILANDGEILANFNAIAANDGEILANTNAIAGNTTEIANNRDDIDRNARGIAMVAALQHTTVLPGMTQALDLSAAHYEGETGMALNYSRRINDTTQINFGVAATSDFDESVIKGGIGWQW